MMMSWIGWKRSVQVDGLLRDEGSAADELVRRLNEVEATIPRRHRRRWSVERPTFYYSSSASSGTAYQIVT
jgi:hypothetical protein